MSEPQYTIFKASEVSAPCRVVPLHEVEAMAAEIERLKEELQEHRGNRADYEAKIRQQEADLSAARAALEKVRKEWLPLESALTGNLMHYLSSEQLSFVTEIDRVLEQQALAQSGREVPVTPPREWVPAFLWLANGNTGRSSVTMLMCHLGIPFAGSMSPGDCNDLERCIQLVQAVPGVRESFGAIAAMGPVWAAVVQAWDGLEALYREHGNTGRWEAGTYVLGAYQQAAQDVILGAR